MALNIFSSNNIWSRLKQQYGKIGEIECLDANNDSSLLSNPFSKRPNDLYIGTLDGFVHKFRLREKVTEQSTTIENKTYECLSLAGQNLGTRKAIVKVKAIPISLRRLIALSDNFLFVLDSDSLQVLPNIKLKNIQTFSISSTAADSQSAGSIDLCVSTKRNKLQIYQLDKVNINLIYELPTQDPLISIAMEESGIIACSETDYFVHSIGASNDRRSMGSLQSIFTLNDPSIPTCLTNISPGEYLLNGPNIGITTSLQGVSDRPPIMFNSPPINFSYAHPYLIVLVRDHVHIYSYLDGQLKQQIPLRQCRTLTPMQQETSKTILVATRDDIFLLEPLSVDEQIDQLLQAYRLQEALLLAESNCASIKQRQTHPLVVSTKKRIALIEFSAMNVVRALALFDEIQIDFHEIMMQIPGFLPLNQPWKEIDENLKGQYTQWLNAFCDYMNKKSLEFAHHPDYYSSLLKAFTLIKSSETILEFLETHKSFIPLDCVQCLLDAQLYHAAAILYSVHQKHQQAIEIWKKLVSKEYSFDETFPGVWILAKYVLERQIDRSLEFSTAEWLLEQHEEELALKIFTDKHQKESNQDPFTSTRVIQRLRTHPTALNAYLEHAVFKLHLETDEIHTMLVNIYLDQILSQSDEDNEEIRSKLQAFIVTSNSYRIQSVLNRVTQTNRLRREVALLYGKMNQFEKAFRVLVDELEDFDYAETYCVALSQNKSSEDRKIVAHVLFKVLLSSLEKHSEQITAALLRLLCNNEIEFDFIEVLQRLPSHWSLASLAQILLRALRTYSYTQRSTRIESALNRVQNENLTLKYNQLKSSSTIINEYRRCKHCLQQFYETSCVVFQDGSQVHVHCAKQYTPN